MKRHAYLPLLAGALLLLAACGDDSQTRTAGGPPGPTPASTAGDAADGTPVRSAIAAPTGAASTNTIFKIRSSPALDGEPVILQYPDWDSIPATITTASDTPPNIAIMQSGGSTISVETHTGVVTDVATIEPRVP